MVKIAFQHPQLDVRGSCVALYDYALHNETLLANQSIIVIDGRNKAKNDLCAVLKFTNRFPVFFYDDISELHDILIREDCDILYSIKYGRKNEVLFDDIKTVVHCVFDLSEPHGAVYAAVSKTLAQKYGRSLYVPHLVGLSPSLTGDNMRQELGIPVDSCVFGRYGGEDTFNIPFCLITILELLQEDNNMYFLFMNTPRFVTHPRAIFLDPVTDNDEKNRFIQTCDAHLECGTLGHTFGLAMAEFSVNNKPIIAFKGKVWNTAHYDILGDKALYFSNKEDFKQILTSFDPKTYQNRDMNCYKDFSPAKVMRIFSDVFIHETVKKNA